MADDIDKIRARAYRRGYAAGRARPERDIDAEVRRARDREDWLRLYAAILTGCIQNGTWRTGEKRWDSDAEHASGCARFADLALDELRRRHV